MEHPEKTGLKFTGERLTTERGFSDGAIEHLHRYSFASLFTKDKMVLDIASGEGYGSNLLAANATQVIGIDIDGESVNHARYAYRRPNLSFQQGSCLAIPLEDNSIDVIVSFETIEHVREHDQMMSEYRRVLRAEGCLVLSSPEKKNYFKVDPNNPWHVRELYFEELAMLVQKYFEYSEYFFQRTRLGSLIVPQNRNPDTYAEASGDFSNIAIGSEFFEPMYNIVVCSGQKLTVPAFLSFFRDERSLILRIERRADQVRAKLEYRIGHFILYPVRVFRRLFNGKG